MRLFIAIDLSEVQRAEAAGAARTLQHALEKARAFRAIRWVAPEAMHLTVRFIGEVSDAIGERLRDALSTPIACAPFTVALGDASTFPAGGVPRVVWIGLSQGADGARVVYEQVDAVVRRLGLAPESRDYRAHLTLGRVRDLQHRPAARLREALATLRIDPSPETADHATLYRSHLSPKGPRYEPLTRIPLLQP